MRDMIYFPGFEVKNENWLKFALLYFDTLRPIIPYTVYSEERYLSDTFQRVMGETDLIEPYRPEYEEGSCASILACEEFDVQKYSRYLINRDLTVSKENQNRITAAQNNIEFSLPTELNHIPLERFVQLRNDRSFNATRKAYMTQIEQLIAHQEAGEFFSLEDLLSYKKDFIRIGQRVAAFTASAIVSCFSFYSLLTDQQNAFAPAVASAVIDGFAVKDAYSSLPQYVNSIREKSLARKYVAKIEALNRPVRKKWCR